MIPAGSFHRSKDADLNRPHSLRQRWERYPELGQ
jgi:hypothetical protein